jgi:hypothetical protein
MQCPGPISARCSANGFADSTPTLAVGMASDFDTCNQQVGAEMPLDATPASGEIRVPVRERQYRMQMIGQNHDRVEAEGSFLPSGAKRRTKRAYLIDQNCRSVIRER